MATKADGKLLEMLTGYAAAHQHPFNVFVHMIGIPTIMLGVIIPMTWLSVEIGEVTITLAHLVLVGFVLFYLTLDVIFAVVFAILAFFVLQLAEYLGSLRGNLGWIIAAGCFFGGYLAQFVGHAVEKSMPVLVRHPIRANLAAPFFTVVEVFKIAGLREDLFNDVQQRIAEQRRAASRAE